MRRRSKGLLTVLGLVILVGSVTPSQGRAGETATEQTVRYILAIVRAFRSVYSHSVVEQVKKAGIEPKENWMADDHAVMLPFQFVKLAGLEVKRDFKQLEVGVVSLTPIYSSNFPETPAEVEALQRLTADPKHKIVTFTDGKQVKGLAPDFAVEQHCADCHNHHPNSPRRDFKKGDLMGALVVRVKKESP